MHAAGAAAPPVEIAGGPDVYAGAKHFIDYRGSEVTAENYLSVLEGDAHAMRNIGSGRVINAGSDDRLFLFYSDHGAAGVLGMPTGKIGSWFQTMRSCVQRHSLTQQLRPGHSLL